MSECPLGYFGDTAARRCRRCHKGCETCLGRSPTQCLSCRRGFYHYQETNTCVTLCPAGLYADESKWTVHRHRMSELSTSLPSLCPWGVLPYSGRICWALGFLNTLGLVWGFSPGQGLGVGNHSIRRLQHAAHSAKALLK